MPEEDNHAAANVIAGLLVQVYEIHEIIIAETGGLPGLRDAAIRPILIKLLPCSTR